MNIRNLFIFTFVLAISISCQEKEKEEAKLSITLAGKITNPKGDLARVSANDFSQEISLDSTGAFVTNWEIDKPGYYNFGHGNESTSVFLNPGDSVYITLDTEQFDETLQYSGDGAGKNNYLASEYLLNEKTGGFKEKMLKDEATFITFMDSVIQANKQNLESQAATINDKNFSAKESQRLKYKFAVEYGQYGNMHSYYAKDPEFKVSDQFNDYKSDLDVNNESLLDIQEYKSYLRSYVNDGAQKIMKSDTAKKVADNYYEHLFSFIETGISSSGVKEYLLQDNIYNNMTFIDHETLKKVVEKFKATSKNEKYITKIDEKYSKWSKLTKGNPAPGFKYVDIAGNSIALSDFNGKYVYIDTWATWCGPCLRELPHLEKLQEEFKDKNITFMSVSIDDSKEDWEEMVEEKEMKGVQLYAEGAWKSSIVEDYMIRGIPRFILVDTEGNIISAQASRPSGNLKEELEALPNI